jgi:hypothetical protein
MKRLNYVLAGMGAVLLIVVSFGGAFHLALPLGSHEPALIYVGGVVGLGLVIVLILAIRRDLKGM